MPVKEVVISNLNTTRPSLSSYVLAYQQELRDAREELAALIEYLLREYNSICHLWAMAHCVLCHVRDAAHCE